MVVLDDGAIGSGMTGATTAHLANALDDRYFEIERLHGERGARLAAESHTAAIDRIESIVSRERIDCDFERLDGYLFCAPEHDEALLDRELAAAHRAGLHNVERSGARRSAFDTGPCLRFPNQAQFHPLKYLAGLADAIERDGGRIYTGTHATQIEGGTDATRRRPSAARSRAGSVVVATNTPVNDLVVDAHEAGAVHDLRDRRAACRAARCRRRSTGTPAIRITTCACSRAIDADARSADRRRRGSQDRAGRRHRANGMRGSKPGRASASHRWARWRTRWGGQVMETVDGLAFIGRNPLDARQRLHRHRRFRHGHDARHDRRHAAHRSDPRPATTRGRRSTTRPASRCAPRREFAKEAVNIAAQYADWMTPGDVESVDEIARTAAP